MDTRYNQLANILVNYSTRVQRGEKVLVYMIEPEAMPLAQEVYKETVKAGGLAEVYFNSAYFERALLKYGSDEQIRWTPEVDRWSIEWADVWIGLRAIRNPHELHDIPAERLAAHSAVVGQLSNLRVDSTRWVICRVPTEAFAQRAEMSLDEATDFFFNATVRDWATESKQWEKWKETFQQATQVRIVGRDTDLTFSTAGRTYKLADGDKNIPDGEFFTAPVETSVEGKVYFEFPGLYLGRKIHGIRLEFQGGRVVKATADDDEELLHKALDTDAGARFIGEFGVGVNYGIDRYVFETLFDEKMGGTIHLAMGRAYKENGGVVESNLHWDIVKDLRREGAIWLDGRKVFAQGKFLL
ncbi:MAG: aminopeptidase [Anaerolineae bacterium]|nr:aminopeptidase [Anaerolineae bacterium]